MDGKCVGNAPAELLLAVGPHTVLVKSPGSADYVRVIGKTQVQQAHGERAILKAAPADVLACPRYCRFPPCVLALAR